MNQIFIRIASLLLAISFFADVQSAEKELEPWRLSKAFNLPNWLELNGHHRFRYETLDGQFRAARNGGDQIVAFRTALKAKIKLDVIELTAEILDSRQTLADSGTALNSGIVNTVDLLQGNVAIHFANRLGKGQLQMGRQTMNVGSRRLVARNIFRNTISSFTGINSSWTAASGKMIRAFYVLPVNRLPSDKTSLLDNETKYDKEEFDVQFWGLYSKFPDVFLSLTGELYLFGLHEDDSPDRATRNRNLYTTGFRFYRKPALGQFDFEVESVFQTGQSRASKAAKDTTDLDHFAHFQHIQAGYTFGVPWSPRLILQFDYASGDKNPDDDNNNRFDTLYGARRFEFGPTGVYGPFARSNLISPGYRLIVKPRQNLRMILAHRFYWLASDKDAWTTSGVRDSTGNSGNTIGNQAEIIIRWDLIPSNIRIETGAAHLFAGEFMKNAPNANGEGDASYIYLQTIFTF